MDIFSVEKRSDIMSRIRSSGTIAERVLFAIAIEAVRSRLGGRKRVFANASHIIGTPDVYIPSIRLALFLDGCFFHGCPAHGRIPKTNVEYWQQKIARNKLRDRRSQRLLRQRGMSVWRFWEHDLKPSRRKKAEARVQRAVDLAIVRNELLIGNEMQL